MRFRLSFRILSMRGMIRFLELWVRKKSSRKTKNKDDDGILIDSMEIKKNSIMMSLHLANFVCNFKK